MSPFIILLAGLLTQPVAENPAPALKQPSVFELPFIQGRYMALQQVAAQYSTAGKHDEAEKVLRQAMELVPFDPLAKYNLACALARQEKNDEAFVALTQAVEAGFNQADHMQRDPDLAALRKKEEFAGLVEKAKTAMPDPAKGWQFSPAPVEVTDGVANVTETNTAWDGRLGALRPLFRFAPSSDAPAVKGMGEAGKLVQNWYEEKTASGNHGDLYDNHDTDHSNMSYEAFPQLARIEFVEEAKKMHLHHGLQGSFFYNAPTIGNSSTAMTNGPFWRCQGRNALGQTKGAERLALQYFTNHIYFYPEHRDYDPGHNGQGDGYGDVLPANTPYIVLSQGSSGSDRAFMDAFALTWAAFQPDVKQKLRELAVLGPTSQMIFRRSNKQVATEDDYFKGTAHPPVFDGGQLDPVRMVTLAHEMTVDALPPIVQIQAVEENEGVVGVDYFDAAPREKLFDTPAAISRVVKSVFGPRRIVVSAENSKDINNQPLTFRWVLLRGDPKLVKITPQGENGAKAEIIVERHERRPIAEGSAMESCRVDVGVFAINEKYPSAPAFISFLFLENQKHTRDENGRLVSVDYADPEVSKNYVDPLLDLKKNWRDEYRYDAGGKLIGWDRTTGENKERFTFDGCLVTKTDNADRPLEARVMSYQIRQVPNQPPVLTPATTEQIVKYVYDSKEDKQGKRAE